MRKVLTGIGIFLFAAAPLLAAQGQGDTQVTAGKMTSLADGRLTIKSPNDKTLNFTVSDDTTFRTLKNGRAKSSDFREGENLVILYTAKGGRNAATAVYQSRTLEGKISKVANKSFTITDADGKAWNLKVPSNVTVMVADTNGGNNKKLADLDNQQAICWCYQDGETIYCPAIQQKR